MENLKRIWSENQQPEIHQEKYILMAQITQILIFPILISLDDSFM